NCIKT
ncbi:hypothetical protein TSUD_391740, partial [Trifolium subterraneum]